MIPFNKPYLPDQAMELCRDAHRVNQHISGCGPFTKKCEDLLTRELGSGGTLLTTSCTHALEMSALLLNLREGDEVIVPSFTFVSTANAFLIRGASPRFVDIREDTLNIDETKIEAAISPQTKAIVVVHYAGVGCEMEKILEIGRRHQIPVIEDNAHGLFGRYKGKSLGSFGSFGTLSFHETKNFSCGEGGALIINDPAYLERAEIIREKGTNRAQFFRNDVDKYTWVDIGSSYPPSDLLAAVLFSQLDSADRIQGWRKAAWHGYQRLLAPLADEAGFRLPVIPEECEQAYHMFYLLFESSESRDSCMDYLRDHGVHAVFHYIPLHSSPQGRKWASADTDECPVTTSVSGRILRLPFFNEITPEQQQAVAGAIRQWMKR